MYNKLHSRNTNVLLNSLLSLPVLILLAEVILSEEKMLILSAPLKIYLLYTIVAFIPAHLLYKLLMPLHEAGHYMTALLFKKRHGLDVAIWMDKKHAFCSKWRCYSTKEARLILCAGIFFKFIYCLGIILFFAKKNIKLGTIMFAYVIWFEVVLNAFPILEESDGYKLIHINAFYNEEIKERNAKEELFVKRIYPWILAGMTFAIIVLFSIIDKVLMLLVDYL